MSEQLEPVFRIRRVRPSRHAYWVVLFRGKRVAAYTKWDRAMEHVEKCVVRFGRGYL